VAEKLLIETVVEAEVVGMLNALTVGGVVSEDDEAKAVAMAATWAEVRLLRLLLPIPPVLLLMAFWIWVALLPLFAEEARGLWQLAQLEA
jgi:hypothetical protein